MSELAGLFRKQRLRPSQLRAVAELRLGDAEFLLGTGKNGRANGAIYIGGFVIECLLKAMLLERHPNLRYVHDPAQLSQPDLQVFGLLYSHDLDDMLGFLPEVPAKLKRVDAASGSRLWTDFQGVCAEWTIYARYSPKRAGIADARRFVATIREVKAWLEPL